MPIASTFNEQSFIENHLELASELSEAVTEASKLVSGMEPFLERFLSPASAKWKRLDVAPYFDHVSYRTERCLSHLTLHRLMLEEYDAGLQKLDSEGKISSDAFALMTTNNRACLKQVEEHAKQLEEAYGELGGHILKRFPEHRELSHALKDARQRVTTDQTLARKFKL